MTRNSKVIVLLKRVSDAERKILRTLSADQICIDYVNTIAHDELSARTIKFAIPAPAPELVLQ